MRLKYLLVLLSRTLVLRYFTAVGFLVYRGRLLPSWLAELVPPLGLHTVADGSAVIAVQ